MTRGFNDAPVRPRPKNAKSEAHPAYGMPRVPLPADLPGSCRIPKCGATQAEPLPAGWARVQVIGRRASMRAWCSSLCASYALARPTRREPGGPGTCQESGCGTPADTIPGGVDTSGWIRTQVTGSTDPARLWCSGLCAVYGLALAELRLDEGPVLYAPGTRP
ncbi:hypothetical protein JHN53_22765 [Streptomyces sp. MBT58]|uniref:hypothetical protein n=1 Tax=Streptomyces sp. MBT58 TaxID=1488389 RepID=UPI00191328E5|nr:hypothetical protein [Streptomyces sp. MBT58]MBK5994416.1 hypothetical protein [Streptomyces sp. MBT58]